MQESLVHQNTHISCYIFTCKVQGGCPQLSLPSVHAHVCLLNFPFVQIVSCSGDGQIAFNDVENTAHHGEHMFNCHYGTAYEVTLRRTLTLWSGCNIPFGMPCTHC